VTADFEYITETWVSSWGGSLGRGSLEKALNDWRRLGWEVVTISQIIEGHDYKGQVGIVLKVPPGTIAQINEEARARAERSGHEYHD
jgi:hypothetical protein